MKPIFKLALVCASVVAVPAFARTIVCTSQTTSTVLTGLVDASGDLVSLKGQDADGDLHIAGLSKAGADSLSTVQYRFRAEREDANCKLDLVRPDRLARTSKFTTHLDCEGISGGAINQDNSTGLAGNQIPGEAVDCTLQ